MSKIEELIEDAKKRHEVLNEEHQDLQKKRAAIDRRMSEIQAGSISINGEIQGYLNLQEAEKKPEKKTSN